MPSLEPTPAEPSSAPSGVPSSAPTASARPTLLPTLSAMPSFEPSTQPTTEDPPSLVSAIFSSDGSSISLTLRADTDTPTPGDVAGDFACDFLLFTELLGADPRCRWEQEDVLLIIPDGANGASILPFDVLTLRGGIVTVGDVLAVEESVVVEEPDVISAPELALSAPATIGICDTATIVLSATDTGGREFATLEWNFVDFVCDDQVPEDVEAASRTAAIERYQTLADVRSYEIVVDQDVAPGCTLTFEAVVRTFLGGTSDIPHSITRVRDATPVILIDGGLQQSLLRRYETSLSIASASLNSTCEAVEDLGTPTFSFELTGVDPEIEGFDGSFSMRQLLVPPFSFAASTIYIFNITSTATTATFSGASTQQVEITVGRGELIPIIEDGDRIVGNATAVLLSACDSEDEDEESFLPELYNFSWACEGCSDAQVLPTGLGECELSLLTDSVSEAQVFVTIFDPASNRTATEVTSLQIRNQTLPDVTVSVDGPLPFALGLRFSRRQGFAAIDGTITPPPQSPDALFDPVWTIDGSDGSSIALSEAAFLSPSALTLSVNLGSSAFAPGVTYSFTLTALPADGETVIDQASASIALTVNQAPIGGQVVSTPTTGGPLSTIFTWTTSLWSDPEQDLPIRYSFAFEVNQNGVVLALEAGDFQLDTTIEVRGLPSGTIDVFATAQDVLGAHSRVETDIFVAAPLETGPELVGVIEDFLDAGLDVATLEDDSEEALNVVLISASQYNSAVEDSLLDDTEARNLTGRIVAEALTIFDTFNGSAELVDPVISTFAAVIDESADGCGLAPDVILDMVTEIGDGLLQAVIDSGVPPSDDTLAAVLDVLGDLSGCGVINTSEQTGAAPIILAFTRAMDQFALAAGVGQIASVVRTFEGERLAFAVSRQTAESIGEFAPSVNVGPTVRRRLSRRMRDLQSATNTFSVSFSSGIGDAALEQCPSADTDVTAVITSVLDTYYSGLGAEDASTIGRIDVFCAADLSPLPVENLAEPLVFDIPVLEGFPGGPADCAFYNDTTDAIETDGCDVAGRTDVAITCACTHATDFLAVVGAPSSAPSPAPITTVGTGGGDDPALSAAEISGVSIGGFLLILLLLLLLIYFLSPRRKQRHEEEIRTSMDRYYLFQRTVVPPPGERPADDWESVRVGSVGAPEEPPAADPDARSVQSRGLDSMSEFLSGILGHPRTRREGREGREALQPEPSDRELYERFLPPGQTGEGGDRTRLDPEPSTGALYRAYLGELRSGSSRRRLTPEPSSGVLYERYLANRTASTDRPLLEPEPSNRELYMQYLGASPPSRAGSTGERRIVEPRPRESAGSVASQESLVTIVPTLSRSETQLDPSSISESASSQDILERAQRAPRAPGLPPIPGGASERALSPAYRTEGSAPPAAGTWDRIFTFMRQQPHEGAESEGSQAESGAGGPATLSEQGGWETARLSQISGSVADRKATGRDSLYSSDAGAMSAGWETARLSQLSGAGADRKASSRRESAGDSDAGAMSVGWETAKLSQVSGSVVEGRGEEKPGHRKQRSSSVQSSEMGGAEDWESAKLSRLSEPMPEGRRSSTRRSEPESADVDPTASDYGLTQSAFESDFQSVPPDPETREYQGPAPAPDARAREQLMEEQSIDSSDTRSQAPSIAPSALSSAAPSTTSTMFRRVMNRLGGRGTPPVEPEAPAPVHQAARRRGERVIDDEEDSFEL